MYVSQPTFTERNDPRPTYFACAAAVCLAFLDYALRGFDPRGKVGFIGLASVFACMIALMLWLYCLMGCIWHPVPKQYRDQEGLTLHLASGKSRTAVPIPSLASLDSLTADDEQVNANHVELRDRIQWLRILTTTLWAAVVAFSLWYTHR